MEYKLLHANDILLIVKYLIYQNVDIVQEFHNLMGPFVGKNLMLPIGYNVSLVICQNRGLTCCLISFKITSHLLSYLKETSTCGYQ